MSEFSFLHLYPETLRLNGESGNVLALQKKLEWNGHKVAVFDVEISQQLPKERPHLVFIGSGTSTAAKLAFEDLSLKSALLKEWKSLGTVFLGVGVGFDLLSEESVDKSGGKQNGLGFLECQIVESEKYLVGEVVTDNGFAGFINTNKSVKLKAGISLGSVTAADNDELLGITVGVNDGNVWGAYLQGPLLPMNPEIANQILAVLTPKASASDRALRVDELAKRAKHLISKRVGGNL